MFAAHFTVPHERGYWKWVTFFHLARVPDLSTYSFRWYVFEGCTVGLWVPCVHTYVRITFMFLRIGTFLKAVNLKVKLIEPIFRAHLLTLLMCLLNRRSQIWVSLAKRPESANGYIQSWGSLANSTVAVKKADLEKVQSFFSKVMAQKEKSLWQSHEIKACVFGSEKITILRLCVFVSCLLHGTALILRKFSLPFLRCVS